MKHLIVTVLLLCSSIAAFADADNSISKQRLFQISCERAALIAQVEFGGSQVPKGFFKSASQQCKDMAGEVSPKVWAAMNRPSEVGCNTVMKAISEDRKLDVTKNFYTYCYNPFEK